LLAEEKSTVGIETILKPEEIKKFSPEDLELIQDKLKNGKILGLEDCLFCSEKKPKF